MFEEQRLARITQLVEELHQVSTTKLCEYLHVSRETVRRDIIKLAAQGALKRSHGSVMSATALAKEAPLAVRNTTLNREKKAIDRAAVKLLNPGMSVFIDSGSTTTLLAEELISTVNITVITNNLNLCAKLMELDFTAATRGKLMLLGGEIDTHTQAIFGAHAIAEIQRYQADIAILCPYAMPPDIGASSYLYEEAEIARAMRHHATRCCILADHSKFAKRGRAVYATPQETDILISDAKAQQLENSEQLRSHYANLIFA